MKEIRILMGMPVTVEVVSSRPDTATTIGKVFDYFKYVDETFSTYKPESEISKINAGSFDRTTWSEDMQTIFKLAEETRRVTGGYFNIERPYGGYDPSGIVKGWAILNAAKIIERDGFADYYVDAGGDIQVGGRGPSGAGWTIGIKDPWNAQKNIKIIRVTSEGVATSGTYIRGSHIYDPISGNPLEEIVSLTVIGPNIYEADRFATAAFAMGKSGISFIEALPGFEGYMIDKGKTATMTSGFEQYTITTHA